MSYYILPRINTQFIINIKLNDSKDGPIPYISSSLLNYLTESSVILDQQIVTNNQSLTMKMLSQVIHSHDYLFSNILGLNTPVSSLENVAHPVFYDFVEIYSTLKLKETVSPGIQRGLFCGKNASVVRKAYEFVLSTNKLNTIIVDKFKSSVWSQNSVSHELFDEYSRFPYSNKLHHSMSFIYVEAPTDCYTKINEYVLFVLKSVLMVMKYQCPRGCFVMKVGNILYKPIIDLIYIITSMYSKCYIMKPNTSNVITDERYIVCKSFTSCNDIKYHLIENIYNKLKTNVCTVTVASLLDNSLYNYFLNKIEESNVIIGQQKLDAYAQLITILKSKNKLDKIDILKKHNIQKCLYWCEKFGVPCNKVVDKNTSLLTFIEKSNLHSGYYDVPDANIEEIFYTYMEKNYGYVEEPCSQELRDSTDIIDARQLELYRKNEGSRTETGECQVYGICSK